MKKFSEKVDLITNILTIVVAVILIGLFIQKYVLNSDFNQKSKTPTLGKVVSVENLDFSKGNKNVLLVMMKGCRFCEESMPFYKKLIQENQNENVKITSIFPPKSSEIESYLKNYGIANIEVKFSELSNLEVDGTPTIIVTKQKGEILKFWQGRLSSEKEIEVINYLKL